MIETVSGRELADAMAVDLTDPLFYRDERPEEVWRVLRSAPGPFRSGGLREHWAVSRYAHVQEAHRKSVALSSEKGMHLGEKPSDDRAGEAAGGMSLLVSDDPAHAQMRKAVGAAFTPRMMARLTDSTHELARSLVAEAAIGRTVDFVEAVAAPLPAIVICDLLGVPPADRDHVTRLTQHAFSGSGHVTSESQLSAHAELFAYCDTLLTAKRDHPGEDVATALAHATMDGRPMPREVAVMNCHDLIAGGNETARHTSSAAALTMVTHPGQWAALRAGEVELDSAVEEVLRVEAPVNHVMRTVIEEVEIGGARMRPGELVTLWLRSANRDADVFTDPDELRFDRRPNRHLTFGLGSHYCVAATLARIEIRAVLAALLDVVERAELRRRPRRLESSFFRGYRSMPLVLVPRSGG